MAPDAAAVAELAASTRLFVTRHAEALHAADFARVRAACEGLHHGLCATLAAEAGALHNALRDGETDAPAPGPAFADGLARVREGGAREREAWAFASLAKRLAEAEGALLHLNVTLARGTGDGPALLPFARRVAGEMILVEKTLAALLGALDAWAAAHAAALGGAAPAAPPPSSREALRAARECLLARAPAAAAGAIARGLLAGLAAPFGGTPATMEETLAAWRAAGAEPPAGAEACRAAHRALLDPERVDLVLAWRLLDFAEHVANAVGMTPFPASRT